MIASMDDWSKLGGIIRARSIKNKQVSGALLWVVIGTVTERGKGGGWLFFSCDETGFTADISAVDRAINPNALNAGCF
jgi:hypothetical protein